MVPMCPASMLVTMASTAIRLTRHMYTLGRMVSRRFTVRASSSASGSEPWVISLPTADGIGISSG